jgi:hypothetical protein
VLAARDLLNGLRERPIALHAARERGLHLLHDDIDAKRAVRAARPGYLLPRRLFLSLFLRIEVRHRVGSTRSRLRARASHCSTGIYPRDSRRLTSRFHDRDLWERCASRAKRHASKPPGPSPSSLDRRSRNSYLAAFTIRFRKTGLCTS